MIYTPLLILAQAGSLASHQPNPFIQFFPLLILIGVIAVILIFKAQRKKHLIQEIQHKRFQEQYYYLSAEQSVAGPATLEALSKRYPHGSTLVCLPGTEQWTPLEDAGAKKNCLRKIF